MPTRALPDRPDINQYRKQAKDLLKAWKAGEPDAVARATAHAHGAHAALTAAQFVLAREHGFESWPKFAAHIETLRITRRVAALEDPVAAFIEAAFAPRDAHNSGTIEEAEAIRAKYPHVARANVFTAAMLGDEAGVRSFVERDARAATVKGGALACDALTHLCFSRYLRLDRSRSDAFVNTARVLLDAGAPANTGWDEVIDQPNPRTVIEAAIYGAAGIAQHASLTKLLLERGADPNDEETPYHVPETRDNTVLTILLESKRLNATSLSWLLLRKADWHDGDGLRLVLDHGGDPNFIPRFGRTALYHAVLRDNDIETITLLLERGADPSLGDVRSGRTAIQLAAARGRGDVLLDLVTRGIPLNLTGVDAVIAACAVDDRERIKALLTNQPALRAAIVARAGTLLAEFSGVGNVGGVRNLLDAGVSPGAIYEEGDAYYGTAKHSTALHVAAWRANHDVVEELIARGTPVNALDGQGRTALQLAVKATVDSYWTRDRKPDSVKALLDAGATTEGIELPCGYDEVDALLVKG